MKLHDLRPAAGAHRRRTRVGRGIAAGKGKTAGRGTKGQRSRAGGSIPPWFEGGQTPLHMRIPKLRGFRNPFKVEYEVVNVGRIAALVAAGKLEATEPGATEPGAAKGRGKAKSGDAPITVNQEILRATGLVSSLKKPLKILGEGDVDVALFVVADAFTASARTKIEAAGGTVQVLEVPTSSLAALGVEVPPAEPIAEPIAEPTAPEPREVEAVEPAAVAPGATPAGGAIAQAPEAVEPAPADDEPVEAKPKKTRAKRTQTADADADAASSDATDATQATRSEATESQADGPADIDPNA
jgi:large subunit ribosomal protein L15